MKCRVCPAALALLLLSPLTALAGRNPLDIYAEAEEGWTQRSYSSPIVVRIASPRPPQKRNSGSSELEKLRAIAYSKAVKYNISPKLFEAIIWHESGFQTSCLGAAGEFSLGQILPSTWDLMKRSGKISGSPWSPENNLEAAAIYIRDSYASLTRKDLLYAARMGYQREHLILSLYNGGRGTLNRYVNASRPLPPKLIAYVKNVVKIHNSLGREKKRRGYDLH